MDKSKETSESARFYIGEVFEERGVRVRVTAYLDDDGCLYLDRKQVDNPDQVDSPVTIVTREGLLRLSQGPFEKGFIEDRL